MISIKKLSREEMRSLKGGVYDGEDGGFGTCSATCTETYSVNCSGYACAASDGFGCYSYVNGVFTPKMCY